MNIQDEAQKEPDSFERRFLYHQAVQAVLPEQLKRKKFYSAFRGKVIEAKADDFGSAIKNAIDDHADPKRLTLILQSFVDELYRIKNLGHPPEIKTTITESAINGERDITWNIDFRELSKLAGPQLNFGVGVPLTAGGVSNRLLWAAAQLNCDLYLAQPMGVLIGDKLFEAEKRILATSVTIESLERSVEFPDVRNLINFGKMNIDDVLLLRENAGRFREWLKIEGERDRDAIIAYHNEVAKESGFTRIGKKMFSAFGVIGGAAIGALAESEFPGVSGAIAGASAAAGIGYLFDIVSKRQQDWKPVMFGSWMKERIEKMIEEME